MATKAIGDSLTAARRAGGGNILNRGDAVWVTVSRPVNWLQPTGILPELKFPGGASDLLRDRVRADIRHTLRFFRESYQTEADYSKFTIYVPSSIDALFDALTTDYPSEQFDRHEIEKSYNNNAGWVPHGAVAMVMKPEYWTQHADRQYGTDAGVWLGRSLSVHEYAHVIQWQLRDIDDSARAKPRGDETYSLPFWIEEGNATWVEDALLVWDGASDWDSLRRQAFAATNGLGKLDFWQGKMYTLGRAAFHELAAIAGEHAWLEMWRQAAPIQFGPERRWSALTPWKTAFQNAFRLSYEEFEQRFEQARAESGHLVRGRVTVSPAVRSEWGNLAISSRVAIEVTGLGNQVRQLLLTDPSGEFAVRLPDGEYLLVANLGGSCTVTHSSATGSRGRLRVSGSDISGLRIALGPNSCDSSQRPASVLHRVSSPAANERFTVRGVERHSSDKLLGWISGSRPVSDLFAAIPELRAVWAFDPNLRQWRRAVRPRSSVFGVAAPDVPAAIASDRLYIRQGVALLSELKPGMAILLQNAKGESLSYARSGQPARGSVTLKPGLNTVAWLGVDGMPLADAVRGIGTSLEQVAVWSASLGRYSTFDADNLRATRSGPTLNRGDAVWVTVNRTVHWLQPTGELPQVKFPGGVTYEVKQRVMRSLEDVLDFYRETYAVEADFSQFIVYAPSDGEALMETLVSDFPEEHFSPWWIRQSYEQGTAWVHKGAFAMVLPQVMWQTEFDPSYPDESPVWRGRFVTAHEYAHVLQWQLRDIGATALMSARRGERYDAPEWLVEGHAMRIMDAIHEWDGVSTREASYLEAYADILGKGTLEYWQHEAYRLGRTAALHLETVVGQDAWLEYWRALAPTEYGPANRWLTPTTWTQAFADAFGQPYEEYLEDFESERESWGHQIRAQIMLTPELSAVVGDNLLVSAIEVELDGFAEVGPSGSRYVSASTTPDENGAITFTVADGDYRLAVNLGRCKVYYQSGNESDEWFRVAGDELRYIQVVLDLRPCGTLVSGQLVDADGNPISGASMYARLADASSVWTQSSANGTFFFTLPQPGSYRLEASIDSCRMYFRLGAATTVWDEGTIVEVGNEDLTRLLFKLPDKACELTISGLLVRADGNPIADTSMYARLADGTSVWARTASDGSFSVNLPKPGAYRLEASINGCWVYYRPETATMERNAGSFVQIDDVEVAGLQFTLPTGVCAVRVSGTLVDAHGTPIGDANVRAQLDGGAGASVRTVADGTFTVTVPKAGAYRLSMRVDGCTIYYARDGATGSYQQSTLVPVSDVDVVGIEIRLSEGMCERRVSGKLLNADGTPRSGQWVSASGDAGQGTAWTAADGSFSFTVPRNGTYRMNVYIDGCSIYLGNRGPARDRNSARKITVSSTDVTGIEFRLPADPSTFCD